MIEWKAKFQLEANENEVEIFFLSEFTDPQEGIRGPRIKNGRFKVFAL